MERRARRGVESKRSEAAGLQGHAEKIAVGTRRPLHPRIWIQHRMRDPHRVPPASTACCHRIGGKAGDRGFSSVSLGSERRFNTLSISPNGLVGPCIRSTRVEREVSPLHPSTATQPIPGGATRRGLADGVSCPTLKQRPTRVAHSRPPTIGPLLARPFHRGETSAYCGNRPRAGSTASSADALLPRSWAQNRRLRFEEAKIPSISLYLATVRRAILMPCCSTRASTMA